MIAEALQLLFETARKSSEVRTIKLPGGQIGLIQAGKVELMDDDRKARAVTVFDVPSFIRWVSEIAEDRDTEIRVGTSRVIAIVDQELPVEDACRLNLQQSAALEALDAWRDTPAQPKQVVRWLRSQLAGTYNEKQLAVFRRLNFKRIADQTRAIRHDGESLGRSVEVAAQSFDGDIPDEMRFDVPVFAGLPYVQPIHVAIELDCEAERVAIMPVGDSWEMAVANARNELVEYLKSQLGNSLVLAGE